MADGLDNEDVPPLEDMSEELDKMRKTEPVRHKPTPTSKQPPQTDDSASFGGLKKGFLLGGSGRTTSKHTSSVSSPSGKNKQSKEKTSQAKDNVPFLKPKSKASGLELPEVQEAMKETFPFLETQDWVTDDLLSKVENHPNLSKVFQDPKLSHLLAEFQKNPEAVLAAAKDNKEMQAFLQNFCALMGDHFTSLADKQEKATATAATSSAPLITEVHEDSEEEKIREIMSRPNVKESLEDKDIQTLLVLLKNDPNRAHQMMRTATPSLHDKIKVLIQNGLLAMQP